MRYIEKQCISILQPRLTAPYVHKYVRPPFQSRPTSSIVIQGERCTPRRPFRQKADPRQIYGSMHVICADDVRG
eukprot:6872449-Pyramimonas_sp.AAC.1